MKGMVEGQEFLIATLTPRNYIYSIFRIEHPHQRVDLKFNKDCLFVSFEVVGDCNVDIVGYVTGLDGQKLLSLKEAMELPEASDDEDYKEPEEPEEPEKSEEPAPNAEETRDAVDFNQPVLFSQSNEK